MQPPKDNATTYLHYNFLLHRFTLTGSLQNSYVVEFVTMHTKTPAKKINSKQKFTFKSNLYAFSTKICFLTSYLDNFNKIKLLSRVNT